MLFVKARTVVIDVFGLAPASSRARVSARAVQLAQPIPAVLVCPPVSNVESGCAPGRCLVEVGPVWDGARRSAQIDLDAVFGEHLHEGVEGDGWRVLMMVVARDEVLAGHRRVIPDQSERSRSAPLPA